MGVSNNPQVSRQIRCHTPLESWGITTKKVPGERSRRAVTLVGGRAKNMHASQCRKRIHGRGAIDETPVLGAQDRSAGQVAAKVVGSTDGTTLRGVRDVSHS